MNEGILTDASREEYVEIAEQLAYYPQYIEALKKAQTEGEAIRILIAARKGEELNG